MTVPFAKIPNNLRVPLFYAELDPSRANSGQVNQRTLIIGQVTASGIAPANVPLPSSGAADAKLQGGPGSMLALMTAAYRLNDPFGEVWYLPLADNGGGTAATGSIAFAGTATAAGMLSLYIAGQLVAVPVASGATAAQLATLVAAAVTAQTDLPVTGVVDGGVATKVDLTAKNKGLNGNDIDIRLNYVGTSGGEATPAGIAPTIVAMTGGATNPILTTALANLQDTPFDFIVSPYTDATSMAALTALLNDTNGRWSWSTQVYGHVFMAYRGTYSGLTTFGLTLNDQHTTCIGFNDSPSPNWLWAPAVCAAAAVSLRNDPGQPLQTLGVTGILAPPLASRFPLSLRNSLLFDGISTFTVDRTGAIAIENLITTYQTNAFGQPDSSYLQVETMFLLAYVLRAMALVVTSKYQRKKLAANGQRILPGSNVTTPNIIRADLIAAYQTLEEGGYVQQSAAFAQSLIVEQNAQNPNRVDVLWPAILIDQLRVFALLAQFRLS